MNGKDLLMGMSFVNGKYIEEAEKGTVEKMPRGVRTKSTLKRSLLIAAVITAMVLMMGCAVVYALKMQNMKVGNQERSYADFDEELEFQGYVTYSQQVLTMAGLKGTPGYQAAQEWFDFMQSYDPDNEIKGSVWGNFPEFPEEYDAYGPYSQEMVDKIDEIAEKYDLKLAGAPVELHSGRRFYQELGIDSLLVPGCEAEISIAFARAYEGGSFYIGSLYMTMPEKDGNWPYAMNNSFYFNQKDCFNTDMIELGETSGWKEWNYTTASGEDVLLLMSSEWAGWIICDRADATIAVKVEVRRDLFSEVDGASTVDYTYMTEQQFEQVADAFDFSIQPQYQGAVDAAENVDPKTTVQTQNGYTMELKSAITDGQTACITLGLSVPEGVSLTETPDGQQLYLGFNNTNEVLTRNNWNDTSRWGDWSVYTEDDGDGKENTRNLVIERSLGCDGELAFAPGSVWTLYWEDLVATYWNTEKKQTETLWSAEGTWKFEITFDKDDFRQIELIEEPVTTNVVIGWNSKGDVYGDVTIKSFVLRSLGATVAFEDRSGELTDYKNGKYVMVVMKDGTTIQLNETLSSVESTLYRAEAVIDLDQVDHVLLVDGTKLQMPESE